MTIRKLLGWATLGLVLWWIVTDPHGAAAFTHKLGTFIAEAAHGFSTFFASL